MLLSSGPTVYISNRPFFLVFFPPFSHRLTANLIRASHFRIAPAPTAILLVGVFFRSLSPSPSPFPLSFPHVLLCMYLVILSEVSLVNVLQCGYLLLSLSSLLATSPSSHFSVQAQVTPVNVIVLHFIFLHGMEILTLPYFIRNSSWHDIDIVHTRICLVDVPVT